MTSATSWERLCAGQHVEVFLRPPSGSTSDFSVKEVSEPYALAADGVSGFVLGQFSGWVPATVLEDFDGAAASATAEGCWASCFKGPGGGDGGLATAGLSVPVRRTHTQDQRPDAHTWTAIARLQPGSKLRLVGSGAYRLTLGRTRNALPRAALAASDDGEQWLEITRTGRRLDDGGARLEVLPAGSADCGSAWQPLPAQALRTPDNWPLVAANGTRWYDGGGRACSSRGGVRVHPQAVRVGEHAPPFLSLLVVQAAIPAQNGVGAMTPNRQFVAALEEAVLSRVGRDFAMHTVIIARESDMCEVSGDACRVALGCSGHVGVVCLLSPQQRRNSLRSKGYLAHDRPLFDMMERLEDTGLPTIYPHPSHLWRVLVAKEWPAHMCLAAGYRVPLCTRVARASAVRNPGRAAREALAALQALATLQVEPEGRRVRGGGCAAQRCVAKIACSWKCEGVIMCDGVLELEAALGQLSALGEHASFLVQERIEHVLCEAMVFLLGGRIAGIRYSAVMRVGAPPRYLRRHELPDILGGEAAVDHVEAVMEVLAGRWLAWARAQCAAAVPFLRVDFLLSDPQSRGNSDDAAGEHPGTSSDGPQRSYPEVWTGEVTELSGAVSLEGVSDSGSRSLVFEAMLDDLLETPEGALFGGAACHHDDIS